MCVELTQQAPVWRGPGSPEIAVYFGKNHIFETWRTRECVRSLGFSHSRLTSIPSSPSRSRRTTPSRHVGSARVSGIRPLRGAPSLDDVYWIRSIGQLREAFQKENK